MNFTVSFTQTDFGFKSHSERTRDKIILFKYSESAREAPMKHAACNASWTNFKILVPNFWTYTAMDGFGEPDKENYELQRVLDLKRWGHNALGMQGIEAVHV